MKIKYPLCIVALLFLITTSSTYAQNTTPGVSKGDTFDYTYTFYWETTNPTLTVPQAFVELNETQHFKITVADVSNSILTLDVTKYFKNATENTERGTADIVNEVINVPFGFLILASNIGGTDKMYSSGGSAVFTETLQKTYPDGQRETNHRLYEATGEDRYQRMEAYYDKASGVAYEYIAENQQTANSYVTTTRETMTLTESSIWVVPEFPFYIVPLIFAAGSAILLFTVKCVKKTNYSLF
jgi:hypothetical protein